MSKFYNTKEIAKILGVTDRSVRRYLNTYFSYENKSFLVSEKMLDVLKNEYIGQDTDEKNEDSDKVVSNEEFDIVEAFSKEEYSKFQKMLIEHPIFKQELEYHKESVKSHQRQMELILRNLEQRNFIEANDKNLNNDK